MKRGKNTCKILKEIRRQIAEANDIEFITSECRYHGDCLGTCPKCEAEVRYLEQQLEKKRLAGKAATIIGVSMGITSLASTSILTSCKQSPQKPPIENIDSIDHEIILGDIDISMPDTVNLQPDSTFTEIEGDIAPATPPKTKSNNETVMGLIEDDIDIYQDNDIDLNDNTVYQVVEQKPTFPGGDLECIEFIKKNLKYPTGIGDVQGRVILQFIVEKDGSLTHIEVIRSIDPFFDKEAMRVVQLMPKWIPGKLNGETVRVKYTLPISFRLE